MHVGVLALQGDWQLHVHTMRRLDIRASPVRTPADLEGVHALILPGGESTAMLRLMQRDRLDESIRLRVLGGMPVLATCAGLILLAAKVEPAQASLAVLDVDVVRNAYGRQVHSTVSPVQLVPELGEPHEIEAVFIRAPRVTRVGPRVRVLGQRGGEPVLVQMDRTVAATFHPELADDVRIQRWFLQDTERRIAEIARGLGRQ
jgi:5'-phosphate synthase pdxT subunit